MHRIFRKALDGAAGRAESVIAVMTDVRDFSRFSEGCDSIDVAMFIRRVYIRLIDEYFPFASFYKSTGDGLLLVVPTGKKNLQEISREVIASCVKCHSEFGSICSDEPWINFKVPDKIGIGIARGTACCLVSGDTIIDYSGRLLNLTSRLTDLARPSGIIIDGNFNVNLLSDEQRAIFKEENVYLKGIHEDESITIHFIPEFTSIPQYNRQPIEPKRRREEKHVVPYRNLLKLRDQALIHMFPLESKPASPDDIEVRSEHPVILKGKVDRKYVRCSIVDCFVYRLEGNTPGIFIDLQKLCKQLEQEQVTKNMNVTLFISYVEK